MAMHMVTGMDLLTEMQQAGFGVMVKMISLLQQQQHLILQVALHATQTLERVQVASLAK
jgi:hypothetical protein